MSDTPEAPASDLPPGEFPPESFKPVDDGPDISGAQSSPPNSVYAGGQEDGRQGDERVMTSRFRPLYRRLSDEEKELHDQIKAKAEELEALMEQVEKKTGRYYSLAITSLETSVMWIIKELTH